MRKRILALLLIAVLLLAGCRKDRNETENTESSENTSTETTEATIPGVEDSIFDGDFTEPATEQDNGSGDPVTEKETKPKDNVQIPTGPSGSAGSNGSGGLLEPEQPEQPEDPTPGGNQTKPTEPAGKDPKPTVPGGKDPEKPTTPGGKDPEKPTTPGGSNTEDPTVPGGDEPADPEKVTYDVFQAMTPAQQQEYMQSFESIEAFFDWYEKAKKEYEEANPPIDVGDGSVDLGQIGGNG